MYVELRSPSAKWSISFGSLSRVCGLIGIVNLCGGNDEGQWRASVRVQKKKWRASNVMMKIKKRYTKCWCDEELKWWRIEFDEEFKQWRSLPLLIHRFCFFKNSNQVLLGVFEYNLLRFASDQTWPHSCLARYSINETFFSIHYVCIYLSCKSSPGECWIEESSNWFHNLLEVFFVFLKTMLYYLQPSAELWRVDLSIRENRMWAWSRDRKSEEFL